MTVYISNSFSINMLKHANSVKQFIPIDLDETKEALKNDFISLVGHADTANVLSNILGFEVKFNRQSVVLDNEDILIVAQYSGARLLEGCNKLPEDSKIDFWLVLEDYRQD